MVHSRKKGLGIHLKCVLEYSGVERIESNEPPCNVVCNLFILISLQHISTSGHMFSTQTVLQLPNANIVVNSEYAV